MRYSLITGAARGIGRACAIALAREGQNILINYNASKAAAEALRDEVLGMGVKAELLPFDVRQAEAVDAAIEAWEAAHPEDYVDVLVNNAGVRDDAVMIFMQNEQWERVMDTNLNSFFYVTRRVLKGMLTHRHGRIVNIASLSGISGLPGQVNYSATKGAVIAATKALAQEVGKKKVTVNAVAPGFIVTDMTAELPEGELKKQVPLGRFGTAEEVGDLVAFLASERAAYITGECISINGGLYT